jgi:cobalamin biosynthetic protein CobC
MSNFKPPPAVYHGGNLGEAVRRYGIDREHWIDLSTGINPHGYPVPPIGPGAWSRLPDDDDGLEQLAASYYGAALALAIPGTHAAIRMLPEFLPQGPIGISLLTYGEYAPAFARAGFQVEHFVSGATAEAIDNTVGDRLSRPLENAAGNTALKHQGCDSAAPPFLLRAGQPLPSHLKHLLIVNPNNPTTERFGPETLLAWQRQLSARGGTLIVDEAFMDATPEDSIAGHSGIDGLIVLRSIGKFFGLGGARASFVLADTACLDTLRAWRGPWSLSGPTRVAVRAALLDTVWQQRTRTDLIAAGRRLGDVLHGHGLSALHTGLYAWVEHQDAEILQDKMAGQGVWVRRFEVVPSLRFGLPADADAWARLSEALGYALA